MINERMFRLKKNGEPTSKCYCRDFTKIENYSRAVLDTTQTWECHHRRETHYLKNGHWIRRDEDLTRQQLIEDGAYYNVPPEELIFLTSEEHNVLHNKGKKFSEERKRKISEAQKNRKDQSKKVLCVETGKIFESVHEAERKTGIDYSNISKACLGKYKTAGGYHWQFVN